MTAPMFERVALIGIGLIGSSLSHAMRRRGLAHTIVGHAQSEKTRETALRLGAALSRFWWKHDYLSEGLARLEALLVLQL